MIIVGRRPTRNHIVRREPHLGTSLSFHPQRLSPLFFLSFFHGMYHLPRGRMIRQDPTGIRLTTKTEKHPGSTDGDGEENQRRRGEEGKKPDIKTGGRLGRRDETGLFENQGYAKTLETEPNPSLCPPPLTEPEGLEHSYSVKSRRQSFSTVFRAETCDWVSQV